MEYKSISLAQLLYCPVGWDCRIHRLLLCRGFKTPPNECPGFDTKQSDDEAPVMLEVLGNVKHPFIAIAPWSDLALSSST